MRDRSSVALAPRPVVWPPDDTEESVLGTILHQTAIRTLAKVCPSPIGSTTGSPAVLGSNASLSVPRCPERDVARVAFNGVSTKFGAVTRRCGYPPRFHGIARPIRLELTAVNLSGSNLIGHVMVAAALPTFPRSHHRAAALLPDDDADERDDDADHEQNDAAVAADVQERHMGEVAHEADQKDNRPDDDEHQTRTAHTRLPYRIPNIPAHRVRAITIVAADAAACGIDSYSGSAAPIAGCDR
jgi:hypothetical protein